MSWLITGGAGYIGSHVVDLFIASGESVVVIDNLRTGNINNLEKKVPFFQGDITNKSDLEKLFSAYEIKGIINLAGLKSVSESLLNPDEYLRVNSMGVNLLLDMAKKYGIKIFIQSSTAAVYGNIDSGVANEQASLRPISVYGESKHKAEISLVNQINDGSIRGTSLRYFNVVGAKNSHLRDSSTENLFPIVANSIKNKLSVNVFGTDYPTRDGSCIRDFVHVLDLAKAHLLAARQIEKREIPIAINIGTGNGFSVLEVIDAFQKFQMCNVEVLKLPRRLGDPATLTADVSLAERELGFQPEFGLNHMVNSTY